MPIPEDIPEFFKDMDVEIISEMNPYYKIVKYSFKNLLADGADIGLSEF